MEQSPSQHRGIGPRHSILDLAPLELECMSALWLLSEGTVRDIHGKLTAPSRRAYTTIMTIMDRLARKGIVTRHKVGRAYRYQANLSADEARSSAVKKVVTGFFDGSVAALAAHLVAFESASQPLVSEGASLDAGGRKTRSELIVPNTMPKNYAAVDGANALDGELIPPRLDESLP